MDTKGVIAKPVSFCLSELNRNVKRRVLGSYPVHGVFLLLYQEKRGLQKASLRNKI